MSWPYIWGLIGILILGFFTFLAGWFSGHSVGRKKGFYEGWEDGCDHTQNTIGEERLTSPFRRNMLNAQRSHIPRGDSAGPMRVHTARIRGDFRLPENNPDQREPAKPRKPWRAQR